MNSRELIKLLLEGLVEQVASLTDEDFKKINDGTHEISLKLQRKKSSATAPELSSDFQKKLAADLQLCRSREEGLSLLSASLKNKKELELFARYLDVQVLKQDKIDQIRDKIIEATVGAILRSEAIQGRRT